MRILSSYVKPENRVLWKDLPALQQAGRFVSGNKRITKTDKSAALDMILQNNTHWQSPRSKRSLSVCVETTTSGTTNNASVQT